MAHTQDTQNGAGSSTPPESSQGECEALKARYTGICHNCDKSIEKGDDLRSDYDNRISGWSSIHDDCTRLRSKQEIVDAVTKAALALERRSAWTR